MSLFPDMEDRIKFFESLKLRAYQFKSLLQEIEGGEEILPQECGYLIGDPIKLIFAEILYGSGSDANIWEKWRTRCMEEDLEVASDVAQYGREALKKVVEIKDLNGLEGKFEEYWAFLGKLS